MQNTITLEYKGETIVSKPFTFGIACIMEDGKYNSDGLASAAGKALAKMYEGTVITEDVINSMAIPLKDLNVAISKIIDIYLDALNSIKN